MMYKQGMVIPGHPGNNGHKPWIIGTEEQVTAQKNYIFRGNYGLASKEELMDSGSSCAQAEQMWQLKLKFNFNTILPPEELIETTVIKNNPVELKPGVILERTGLNRYKLSCNGKSVKIDLNLQKEEVYEPPYKLSYKKIKREEFSIIHVGEGNGWDNSRPCMGSVITYKGRFYLIDAGPNIEYSLNALGISVNEIEGIFHTHIHDDHFAGLTYLVMADHKIKYFATQEVMITAKKKLSALMGQDESMFDQVFDSVTLDCGKWNNVEGLEVKPLFSPHPVETSILYFRMKNGRSYKTYGHLADVISRRVLETFISSEPGSGISREWYDKIWKGYLEKADIKKIDIGGGLIHGFAKDFMDDPSKRLILSHTDRPLTEDEKEIGEGIVFGAQDILISTKENYNRIHACQILEDYFPDIDSSHLKDLVNSREMSYKAGDILASRGEMLDSVYILLSGKLNYFYDNDESYSELTSGTMIGITNSIWEKPTVGIYQASTNIETLKIPIKVMRDFLVKHNLTKNLKDRNQIAMNLRCSYLFGSRISSRKLVRLSQRAGIIHLLPGDCIPQGWPRDLYLINKGSIDILHKGKVLKKISRGESWGGFPVYPIWKKLEIEAHISSDSPVELYRFSHDILKEIPTVQWKLYQLWSCWDAAY